ncbi:MAG: TIGR04282 family arsenosugar biosynthesis glycosyltransferase [Alphaproteobacteria bacterium]|nr:TIGR04282 family arsenosugar biosynthesis glycosyltransferase [Alphaproteobacteria bacterium]
MKRHRARKRRRGPDRHLVLFTRAPRLGLGKQRLARGIGPVPALRFHRETTASLLSKCRRDPRVRLWLAITPDGAGGIPQVWPQAGPARVIPQGAGGLGARMGRVFRTLPRGPIVLMGADVPSVSLRDIQAAFRALGDHDAVFGPAGDGGYWLVGFRRLLPPFHPFRRVRWSSPHALADTLGNLKPDWRIARIATRDDVDDEADYRRWRQRKGAA